MTTSTFTPETAQSFNRYSSQNAATVKMRLAAVLSLEPLV